MALNLGIIAGMNNRYFIFLAIPFILYFFYMGNIKPLLASRAFVHNKVQKSLNYNTFINHEARKVLAKQVANGNDRDAIVFSISEMEKNVKERPLDVKSYILLSYLYYRVNQKEKLKNAVNIANKLAPNREDVQKLRELY